MTPPPSAEYSLATLEAMYDAYHRQALGLAYRILQNSADAEEVVQDAFLAIWRASTSYDPAKGSVRTWLFTVVRNRSIDRLRLLQRTSAQPLDPAVDPPDTTDVQEQAVIAVEGQAARRALALLPPEQRQVVELSYFRGLSHGQIAERLATPVGTVKSRLRLALEHLRVALEVDAPMPKGV